MQKRKLKLTNIPQIKGWGHRVAPELLFAGKVAESREINSFFHGQNYCRRRL